MKNLSAYFLTLFILLFSIQACDDGDGDGGMVLPCEIISEDITTTRTLVDRNEDPSLPDYCITEQIIINEGAGLIIEPGVVIEFSQNAGIDVGRLTNGYLTAEGTTDKPIVFTGATKTAGFWRGITVSYYSNDVRNVLNHCVVEYAGSEESSIHHAFSAGVAVAQSTAGPTGRISIKNTTIQNNLGKGYFCKENGLNEFENNVFRNNSEHAIYIDVEEFSKMDENTVFESNGVDGVTQWIAGTRNDIRDGNTHIWKALSGGNAYHLNRQTRVDMGGVEIEPGVNVVMESNIQFVVLENGFLSAYGTSAQPITFRGTNPGTPSWNAIYFKSDHPNNYLDYCNISEAGVGIIENSVCVGTASIGLSYWFGDGGRVVVTNCNITNGGGCGIFTDMDNLANLTETGNSFVGLAGADVCN